MKRKTKRYCYRSPAYPAQAFVAFLMGGIPGSRPSILYPLRYIYTDFEELALDAQEARDTIENPSFLSEESLILPILYWQSVPLYRKYWKKPTVRYEDDTRMNLFVNAVSRFPLHAVLITPSSTDTDGNEYFSAAIPFFLSVTPGQIEAFMMTSDFPVDETANTAALYTIREPFTYNWKQGLILEKQTFLQQKSH